MKILCSFKLVLEGKTGKETPESSRLEFKEKFSANNFASSYAEDNTSGPLNRGGIADLPLLRTLLAIYQKSHSNNSLAIRVCPTILWGRRLKSMHMTKRMENRVLVNQNE